MNPNQRNQQTVNFNNAATETIATKQPKPFALFSAWSAIVSVSSNRQTPKALPEFIYIFINVAACAANAAVVQ